MTIESSLKCNHHSDGRTGDLTELVKLRCPFILCHQRVMGKASSAEMCFFFTNTTYT